MSALSPTRMLAWALALGLLALPLIGLFSGWFASDRWPVRSLQVEGPFAHVSAQRVRAQVQPLLRDGFFASKPQAIRAAVLALPWVSEVTVRKHWPDQIRIRVREHQAIARWNKDVLLTAEGVVFQVPEPPSGDALPHLIGPPGRAAEVLQFYRQARTQMAAVGLDLEGVALSPRGSWRATLAGGAEVMIGWREPQARLQRFVAALPPLLGQQGQPFLDADLRYSNGFAVRWKPAPAAPGENPST